MFRIDVICALVYPQSSALPTVSLDTPWTAVTSVITVHFRTLEEGLHWGVALLRLENRKSCDQNTLVYL